MDRPVPEKLDIFRFQSFLHKTRRALWKIFNTLYVLSDVAILIPRFYGLR